MKPQAVLAQATFFLFLGGGSASAAAQCAYSWRTSDAGAAFDGPVHALIVYNDGDGPALYAGGDFLYAGDTLVSHIARWNGLQWLPLGEGTSGPVFALGTYGGALIAGGGFTTAGSDQARYLARWESGPPGHWQELGQGMNQDVLALAVHDGELVVGGRFSRAGPIIAHHLARWNGSGWSTYDAGVDYLGVYALTSYDGSLFIGGDFTSAGDLSATRIARWYLHWWFPLGQGLNAEVRTLIPFNGRVVAGGAFTASGPKPLNRIAAWDGQTWSPLGAGFDDAVSALAVYNDELIAAGAFTSSGPQPVQHVARWDGSQWLPLADGVNTIVKAMAAYESDLVVGGTSNGAADGEGGRWATWMPSGPRLVSAVSRRLHGDSGPFDLPLSMAGPVTVEPRSGGTQPQVIFTFDQPIEAADGSLDCGQEVSVSNATCEQVAVAGSELIVAVTTGRNVCARFSVSGLRGLNGGADTCGSTEVQVLLHEGDINQDGAVNILDLQAIKNRLNQPVDTGNCKLDVNGNGRINILDLQTTKNNLNQPAACP